MTDSSGAGHGGKGAPLNPMDPGAVGSGTTEFKEVHWINEQFLKTGKVKDVSDYKAISVPDNLYNIVINTNSISKSSELTESHHMNAFNGKATGVEVWHYLGDAKGKALAEKLSAAIAKELGLVNRGAKATTSLYVVANTNATCLLIEWCFVDNPSDIAKWNKNKVAAVNAALKILGYGGTTVAPKPPETIGIKKPKDGLWGRAHVSEIGWTGFVGSEATCGTTGKNLAVEALDLRWDGQDDKISASYQDAKGAWHKWSFGIIGTTGKNLPIQVIRLDNGWDLRASARTIQYRVHSTNIGWGEWTTEGNVAGKRGHNIEAIQFRMLKNGKVERG